MAATTGVSGKLGGKRLAAFRLATYSFLVLFFELALIRYLPANVKVFSYYINFVLIAAFVGMGAGLLAVRYSRWLRWAFPVLALGILALSNWFSNVRVAIPEDPNEYLWGLFDAAPAVASMGTVPAVAILFGTSALFFVPLGALVGEEFPRFRPLVAYSLDIGGSLLGIVAFAVVSAVGWPPWSWFLIGFALLLAASVHRLRYAAALALTSVLAVMLVGAEAPNEEWSSYYRIEWFRTTPRHYSIHVNESLHLTAVDLSEGSEDQNEWVRLVRRDYLAPFHLVDSVDTALVLGAGAGNDVAVLLQRGAQHIDAVEIDAEILELGRELHFQEPYSDPRVQVHIDDARAYLKTTSRKYDVVVFGTLDSQTLLSGMSSVRLDNYVYTLEALEAARDVLAPGGAVVMYHMSPYRYVAAKIF